MTDWTNFPEVDTTAPPTALPKATPLPIPTPPPQSSEDEDDNTSPSSSDWDAFPAVSPPTPVEQTQDNAPGSGNMLTDVWPEMKAAASGAWQTVKSDLNPSNELETAKEAQQAPWWNIAPELRGSARAAEGVAAAANAPFDVALAPAKSILGHPLASAVEAAGEPIATALNPNAKLPTPQQVYEEVSPSAEEALSVAIPSKVPVPAPTPPDVGGPFGPLSAGEEVGDLGMRKQEHAAYVGNLGKGAQQQAQQFFDVQRPERLAEGTTNVAGQMGGPVIQNPDDAADVVANELTTQRNNQSIQAQTNGVGLTKDILDYRAKLSPTGTIQAENPMEAANILQGAVANEAARHQATTEALYDQVNQLPGHYHPAAFNQVAGFIRQRVMNGPDPGVINPQTTPITNSAVADLDDVTNPLKQQRDPDTGRLLPRPAPLTPSVVETARKRLNTFYGAALNSARSTGNYTDLRMMGKVMDAFDQYVSNKLRTSYVGGDGATVADALDAARASHAKFRQTYTPQGAGDVVGPAIQKILGRHEGQAATPEEVHNILYGKGGTPVKVGQRLIKIFGPDSPEIGAIKQGLVSDIIQRPPGQGSWTPNQVADRIDQYTDGPYSSLTRTYLQKPGEMQGLRQIGTRLRAYHPQAFPEPDTLDQMFNRLGDQGTQEARRRLFNDILKGGKDSETMISRLKQRLSPQAWGVYKQGAYRHAAEQPTDIKGWGPKQTADRLQTLLNNTKNTPLYSNYERGLIKSHIDFLRKTEIPKFGVANFSGSGTWVSNTLRSMHNWLARSLVFRVAEHLGGGPVAGLAGLAAERALEATAARASAKQVMQGLPIIENNLQRYYKAVAAYDRSRTPGAKKVLTATLYNLQHSVRKAGIDTSTMPLPSDNNQANASPPTKQQMFQGFAKGGAVVDRMMTKTQAGYRGGIRKRECALCTMFHKPSSCTLVRGHISPRAVCDYYKHR